MPRQRGAQTAQRHAVLMKAKLDASSSLNLIKRGRPSEISYSVPSLQDGSDRIKIMTMTTASNTTLRRAIVVMGMHRSGTSALAGVLAKMGADLPQEIMPANGDNQKEYFESLKIFRLNDAILASAESFWDDWREFSPDWYLSQQKINYAARAAEVLDQEFSSSPFVVLKDPRMCRLLPFWIEVLGNDNVTPLFICTHRHPQEVSASSSLREGWSTSRGLYLWLRRVLDAEAGSRDMARVFVSYDMLLNDQEKLITRITERFKIGWPVNP